MWSPARQREAERMRNDAEQSRRRSIRLKQYDYAQPGAYFVTICTQDRVCLFGHVLDGAMYWNDAGRLIASCWTELTDRFPIALDLFVVMPNHVHGIILFSDDETEEARIIGDRDRPLDVDKRATTRVAPTLGNVVGAFKSLSTNAYIRGVKANSSPAFRERLWQRNYYEHVLRDDADLSRIRRYIDENPLKWDFDDENPQRIKALGQPLWSPARTRRQAQGLPPTIAMQPQGFSSTLPMTSRASSIVCARHASDSGRRAWIS